MRKANETLTQREKQVEPVVKEKPIETEAVEIEGFASSATCFSLSRMSLALFSSTTLIFSLLIESKFSSS
jgi:hypothetical protein